MDPQISGQFPFKINSVLKRKRQSWEGKEHLVLNSFVWICRSGFFICPDAVFTSYRLLCCGIVLAFTEMLRLLTGADDRLSRSSLYLVAACGYHSDFKKILPSLSFDFVMLLWVLNPQVLVSLPGCLLPYYYHWSVSDHNLTWNSDEDVSWFLGWVLDTLFFYLHIIFLGTWILP